MENNIDRVITLDDNSKYMIIDQGNYDGKGYYLTSKLDSAGNLTEELNIFENNNGVVSDVKDQEVFDALKEYFSERNK